MPPQPSLTRALVRALPYAWMSILGGIVGALVATDDPGRAWGYLLPAAVALAMAARLTLRDPGASDASFVAILIHRLLAAYLAFAAAYAVIWLSSA